MSRKATTGSKLTIATLGSHCSLQVLKGAKDEGFRTLLVCESGPAGTVPSDLDLLMKLLRLAVLPEILGDKCRSRLKQTGSVLIPHGTLISQIKSDEIEKIDTPLFGNKWILRWEADRDLKEKLMKEAGLRTPQAIRSKNEINGLCIVKLHGSAGGQGYYLAWNRESFEEGARRLMEQKIIRGESDLYVQEFIRGVPVYFQYFYSPITEQLSCWG